MIRRKREIGENFQHDEKEESFMNNRGKEARIIIFVEISDEKQKKNLTLLSKFASTSAKFACDGAEKFINDQTAERKVYKTTASKWRRKALR